MLGAQKGNCCRSTHFLWQGCIKLISRSKDFYKKIDLNKCCCFEFSIQKNPEKYLSQFPQKQNKNSSSNKLNAAIVSIFSCFCQVLMKTNLYLFPLFLLVHSVPTMFSALGHGRIHTTVLITVTI